MQIAFVIYLGESISILFWTIMSKNGLQYTVALTLWKKKLLCKPRTVQQIGRRYTGKGFQTKN